MARRESRPWRTAALVCLILLAALGAGASAPGSPAAGGEQGYRLGAPVYDTESETTHRQIAWSDFKGRLSDSSRWDKTYFTARVSTQLFLGRYEMKTSKAEGGGWTARPLRIRPYTVMEKFLSAYNQPPTKRDRHRIAHHQGHFDLVEIFARRLAVELADTTGTGDQPFLAEGGLRQKIELRHKACLQELALVHLRYSRETDGGVKKMKQQEWEERLAQWMDEATAALVELMETHPGWRDVKTGS